MRIYDMSKQDFANVPYLDTYRDWEKLAPNGHLEFRSFVVIPVENEDGTIELHESGYGCMEFCLVNCNKEPIGKVGGGSDVVNLDGIGGYGVNWLDGFQGIRKMIHVHGWTFDLLPCGYLNVWTRRMLFLRDRFVGSNMEVFSEDEPRRNGNFNCSMKED